MSLPTIPGYEVVELVGRGGMGRVYRAIDLRLGRTVAVKMLLDSEDPELLARFESEAKSVASLSHPNITRLFEFARNDLGQPYCVMEFIGGGTLAGVIARKQLSWKLSAQILVTLARAIQSAHQEGILHRDLKPANILIDNCTTSHDVAASLRSVEKTGIANSTGTKEPSSVIIDPHQDSEANEALLGRLRISDFGLARRIATDSKLTRTGQIVGTPAYMAPEQASGMVQRPGPGVDIYSLGCILFEMLTGRPPFLGADGVETIMLLLTEDPPSPRSLRPTIPMDLQTICLKCLEKKPSRRYLSATDLAEDLNRFVEGRPILAKPTSPVDHFIKWTVRNPWKAVALGLFASSGIAAMIGIIALNAAYQQVTNANHGLSTANVKLTLANQAAREARDLTRESLDQIVNRLRDGLYDVPQATSLMMEASQDSVNLHRRLFEMQPDDFEVATGYLNSLYSHVYFEWLHGRREQSRISGKQLESVLERSSQTFPDNLGLKIFRLKAIVNKIVDFNGDSGHPENSRNNPLVVEQDILDLLRVYPGDPELLKLASVVAERKMDAATTENNIENYVSAARERVEFSRRYFLAESNETRKQQAAVWLAHAQRVLAQGQFMSGDWQSARSGLQQSIEQLSQNSPGTSDRSIRSEQGQLNFEMARACEKLGDTDVAIHYYTESISLFERLIQDHPDDATYRCPMAVSLIRSAALSFANGDAEVAIRQLTTAEMHVKEVLTLEPANVEATTLNSAIPNFLAQIQATLPAKVPEPTPTTTP